MKKPFLALILLLLVPAFVFAATPIQQEKIVFFYSPGCPHCASLNDFLDTFQQQNPNIFIERLNASENSDKFIQTQQQYGIPPEQWSSVPKLFYQEEYCIGDIPCIQLLQQISSTVPTPDVNQITPVDPPESPITWEQIIGLAIADSINPCEFAVLIILLTAILTRFPNQKQKALHAGLAFTLAIFLIYLLFGMLIIFGFKTVIGFTSFNHSGFYSILALLAIALGLLNIKDGIWYRGAGFLMEVPQNWRPKMKELLNKTTSTTGAFVVGLIVSFFLTPCTAGPYFIAGGILSKLDWIQAAPYLLIYLLIFVLPMILLNLGIHFGLSTTEKLTHWREKNLKTLHLIAGILLTALGLAMLLRLL